MAEDAISWLAIGTFHSPVELCAVLCNLPHHQISPPDVCVVGARAALVRCRHAPQWRQLPPEWQTLLVDTAPVEFLAGRNLCASAGPLHQVLRATGLPSRVALASLEGPRTLDFPNELAGHAAHGELTVLVRSPCASVQDEVLREFIGHACQPVLGHEHIGSAPRDGHTTK